MRFLTYALFAFLLTAGSPVNAQLAPAWTAPTGAVQWMRTTAAGAARAPTQVAVALAS